MDYLSIGDYNFLVFVIPGFLTVWVFRYFTKSNKKGDFELLGLSFVWGLIILIILELFLSKERTLEKLFQNPYAAAIVMSFFGALFGWIGSHIARWKILKKIIDFISPKIEKK